MKWHKGLIVAKDPDSVLDWLLDWTDWLAASETIYTHTVNADAGITVDTSTNDNTGVTVWLSGGTTGTSYTVTVKITTNQGRTVERSVIFEVSER